MSVQDGRSGEQADETDEQLLKEEARNASLPDWLLQLLVDFCNLGSLEFGVTLVMGGTLVTGTVVSRDTFRDGLATLIDENWSKEIDVSGAPGDFLRDALPSMKDEDRDMSKPPLFIHLRDAQLLTPGQPLIPETDKLWWRGRMASVDGWNIGRLEAPQSPS